jgi:hypothetical protein
MQDIQGKPLIELYINQQVSSIIAEYIILRTFRRGNTAKAGYRERS